MTEREARLSYAIRATARIQTGNMADDLIPVLRQWVDQPSTMPVEFIRDRFERTVGMVLGFRRAAR